MAADSSQRDLHSIIDGEQSQVLEPALLIPPESCRLVEFTFCHLTFTERLTTAPSADVSLPLTPRPDGVDADADGTRGP
ncbi:hypothetical protein EYF80_013335 [Liparis tanakae]|uniref:Uncharacterized protein n=1 Tax=Liparis tanakae TaxID=230148 RepID=A0A4Z2IF06_9TELE|nr:hypothetical protein EYF80_013335 [Liparis tanakae]